MLFKNEYFKNNILHIYIKSRRKSKYFIFIKISCKIFIFRLIYSNFFMYYDMRNRLIVKNHDN